MLLGVQVVHWVLVIQEDRQAQCCQQVQLDLCLLLGQMALKVLDLRVVQKVLDFRDHLFVLLVPVDHFGLDCLLGLDFLYLLEVL